LKQRLRQASGRSKPTDGPALEADGIHAMIRDATCRTGRRRAAGLSLLELLVVLTLIGIFAAVASARFGADPRKNFGAEADARRLALDLLQARRRAIATGDNHYLEFTASGGNVVGYTLYRRLSGGGVQAVDEPRTFLQQEEVTVSHAQAEFDFEGAALAAYQMTLTGPNRTWQVTVVPATGTAKVTES
jgi:prepilin-type N-terminal cleavage/methylation domain-containing protein